MLNLSRRQFVNHALSSGVGLSLGGVCTGAENRGQVAAHNYVDIHVHLTQPWYGVDRGPLDSKRLLRWMDAHQISQAVILPLVSPEAFWYPVTTQFVLRETAPHRDRLIPFCAIDPRRLATHLTTTQQVVDMLRRYRDAGARGVGEHKPQLPIDDPLCMRLYEACEDVQFPVLFHLDNKANMDRPGLPGLARVLSRFPEVKFIGHGKGWWASIAGGLTQEDLHVGYPKGAGYSRWCDRLADGQVPQPVWGPFLERSPCNLARSKIWNGVSEAAFRSLAVWYRLL